MAKKLFLFLSVVACVLGAAAIGLNMSPYLAKKLGFAPFRQAAVERASIPKTLVDLINAAEDSVVLASEVIDNRTVLEALHASGQRGVAVVVVLSGPNNTDPGRGARAWLRDRGISTRITLERMPGTILIVDKRLVATSSAPALSTGALSRQQSELFVFEHKHTAASYFERVRNWRFN